MGRRVALSALADSPVEDVPGRSAATLVRLRPDQVAPTPLNSRTNFGAPEELAELGESMRVRQLQPVVVVSRAGYLRLWPEHDEQVGAADYVLVNGERRWRAAIQVHLVRLDALIREEIADSRPAFLDALFTENIDRRNLDPIEEARAVEAMVTECGSAAAAAEHFRRHESWVSQRRALLKLTPEIQERVRTGEIPVRIARSIASAPPDEQEAAWLEARAREDGQRDQRRRNRESRNGKGGKGPGLEPDDGERAAGDAAPRGFTAVKSRGPAAGRDGVESLPWGSLGDLARLIRSRLDPQDLAELVRLLGAV